MKIGIDVYSFDRPGNNYGVGPGAYVWNILPEIIKQSKNDQFYIFANSENIDFIPNADNVKLIVNKLPIKFKVLRIIHEQIFIPICFYFYGLSFIHFMGNNISFILKNKSILTVLDLMWKYYLDTGIKSLRYKYMGITAPRSIKNAKVIITISKFISDEIYEKKIRLSETYPVLLAPCISKINDENSISEGIKSISKTPFIYTVTTSMPHKNLIVLLKAFKIIKKKEKINLKLIVSGQLKGDFKNKTFEFIKTNNLEREIFITGFVSENDKNFLYKNALMVVYPSLYEGFGLPVLEAMVFNSPVITSKAASLPEVGRQACLYFNPNSKIELSEKILLLYNDNVLRKKLIEKGKENLKKFSWKRTAKQTIDIYQKNFN